MMQKTSGPAVGGHAYVYVGVRQQALLLWRNPAFAPRQKLKLRRPCDRTLPWYTVHPPIAPLADVFLAGALMDGTDEQPHTSWHVVLKRQSPRPGTALPRCASARSPSRIVGVVVVLLERWCVETTGQFQDSLAPPQYLPTFSTSLCPPGANRANWAHLMRTVAVRQGPLLTADATAVMAAPACRHASQAPGSLALSDAPRFSHAQGSAWGRSSSHSPKRIHHTVELRCSPAQRGQTVTAAPECPLPSECGR
jgi:hypothetical protein